MIEIKFTDFKGKIVEKELVEVATVSDLKVKCYIAVFKIADETYVPAAGMEDFEIIDLEEKKAKLVIKTRPSSVEVSTKSAILGTTPLETELEPGTYTIILKKEGYEKAYYTVDVRADSPNYYNFDLILETGSIVVKSRIEEVIVYLEHHVKTYRA